MTVWAYYTTDGDAGAYGIVLFAAEADARAYARQQGDAYGEVKSIRVRPATRSRV